MKKIILFKLIFLAIFLFGCQTIQNKSAEIVKKENEKLSKFIGQSETELKVVMGNPDSESKDNKASKILIYKNKKYGISCERKFEINNNLMVVGFTSKGCF